MDVSFASFLSCTNGPGISGSVIILAPERAAICVKVIAPDLLSRRVLNIGLAVVALRSHLSVHGRGWPGSLLRRRLHPAGRGTALRAAFGLSFLHRLHQSVLPFGFVLFGEFFP